MICSISGPLCQPSATAKMPLPAWKTRPVISRLCSLTSQVDTGATHRGSRRFLSPSVYWRRSSVMRVSARGEGGERGEGRLGRPVVGLADIAVDARYRCGRDDACIDRAALGLGLVAPVGGGMARRREGAFQVHLDDGVPLVLAHIDQHAVAQDAGIQHQGIELAEVLYRLV